MNKINLLEMGFKCLRRENLENKFEFQCFFFFTKNQLITFKIA